MTQILVNLTPDQMAAIHAEAARQRVSFNDAAQAILTRGLDWHLAVEAMRPADLYGHGAGYPQGGDA